MNPNSILAYQSIKPSLTKRESEVYEIIKANPGITIREAASKLGKESGQISGRFTDMTKKGAIKIEGTHYYEGSSQPHSKYRVI